MDLEQKRRLGWVKLYKDLRNAGLVCLRCGISRPTLRKWLKRYEEFGVEGLSDQSRKPLNSPSRKVFDKQKALILSMRNERKFGVRRIQNELKRLHDFSLSLATIHKILSRENVEPLKIKRHYRKQHKRYNCKIPSERHSELIDKTPLWEEVCKTYDPNKERIRLQNYEIDTAMKELKPCQ